MIHTFFLQIKHLPGYSPILGAPSRKTVKKMLPVLIFKVFLQGFKMPHVFVFFLASSCLLITLRWDVTSVLGHSVVLWSPRPRNGHCHILSWQTLSGVWTAQNCNRLAHEPISSLIIFHLIFFPGDLGCPWAPRSAPEKEMSAPVIRNKGPSSRTWSPILNHPGRNIWAQFLSFRTLLSILSLIFWLNTGSFRSCFMLHQHLFYQTTRFR